jgi:hypothetical protein
MAEYLCALDQAHAEVQAARELNEDTLNRRRRVLDQDHPDTQRSARNLEADLRSLGEVPDGSGT